MGLYERILCETIAKEVIPSLSLDYARLLELKCYQTIKKIHKIVSDEQLDDRECFERVEAIICALEELGIDGEGRHDF